MMHLKRRRVGTGTNIRSLRSIGTNIRSLRRVGTDIRSLRRVGTDIRSFVQPPPLPVSSKKKSDIDLGISNQ